MASSREWVREVQEEARRAATANLDFCPHKYSLLIIIGRTARPRRTEHVSGEIERGRWLKKIIKNKEWIRKNLDACKLSSMKGIGGEDARPQCGDSVRPDRGCVIRRRSSSSSSSIPPHPCGFRLIKSSALQVSLFYLKLSIHMVILPSNLNNIPLTHMCLYGEQIYNDPLGFTVCLACSKICGLNEGCIIDERRCDEEIKRASTYQDIRTITLLTSN